MVKNVKIDDETHRAMSMKAAQLQAQKSDLTSVLIRIALSKTCDAEIQQLVENYTRNLDNNG